LLVEDDLSLLVSLELLEPAPAAPVELEGEELEDAPPLAGLFVVSLELEELELDGGVALGELADPDIEPEAEPDGEGELVVPPADEEDAEPDGEVVEPEGDVPRSLERLQPVTTAVPSARVTASANVESLMRPPW
jgi:hypothetical protein